MHRLTLIQREEISPDRAIETREQGRSTQSSTMNLSSKMSDEPKPSVSVMEGKGFYNENAAIPAACGALALPLLEQARKVEFYKPGHESAFAPDGSSDAVLPLCCAASRPQVWIPSRYVLPNSGAAPFVKLEQTFLPPQALSQKRP